MSIKIEIEYVCRGCLSFDRKVEPLKKNAGLFFILLADQFIPKNSSYFNIHLCWECVALLRKVAMFQMQIQRSKNIFLQNLDKIKKPVECLSHLSIFHKSSYDEVIEYETVDKEQDIKLEQLFNINKVIKEETNDGHYNDEDLFDTDCTDNIMEITDDISNCVDNQETKLKKKRKRIKSVINTSQVVNDQVENVNYYDEKDLFDTDCTDNIMEITDDISNSVDNQETKLKKKRKSLKSVIKTTQVVYNEAENDSHMSRVQLNIKEIEKLSRNKRGNISDMSYRANVAVKNILSNKKKDTQMCSIMPSPKKPTREERLEKKRQAERLRYQRIKNDPEKNSQQKEKDKKKYERQKEKGLIKTVNQMTPTEKRKARKIWREKAKLRRRRLALQNIRNAPATQPSSDFPTMNTKSRSNVDNPVSEEAYQFVYEQPALGLENTFNNGDFVMSTISCTECSKIVPDRTSMIEHWNDHTITMYKCNYCTHYVNDSDEILNHLQQKHTTIYTCKCGAEFRGLRDYFKHNKYLHNTYDCDICKRRFKSKTNIENHMLRKHLPSKCTICQRNYSNYKMLMSHFYVYHPELKRVNERPYCVECDMRFENDYLYKRHLRSAVAHRPKRDVKVPCPDCGKIFSRKTYMTNHYNLVHVRQSKHYCEICDKYFITGYAIRTHKKFVHEKREKPKDKICEICGRGFFTNRVLMNHRRTHTGERPFMCTYCPAAFAQRSAMKTHERTQHKNYLRTDIKL
ncbi:unnamed protein product [Euphydryas editha]|uniref:C2H2-type domain-containing protein n=1 Tax=Euphydryas editha TaxID=104508 RepID=A0AAU9TDV9_EUPED|nr:unnamed protein product [Euphydryas editha]